MDELAVWTGIDWKPADAEQKIALFAYIEVLHGVWWRIHDRNVAAIKPRAKETKPRQPRVPKPCAKCNEMGHTRKGCPSFKGWYPPKAAWKFGEGWK